MAYTAQRAKQATVDQLEFALQDINNTLKICEGRHLSDDYVRKLQREKDVVAVELHKRRKNPAKDLDNAIGRACEDAYNSGLGLPAIREILKRHI